METFSKTTAASNAFFSNDSYRAVDLNIVIPAQAGIQGFKDVWKNYRRIERVF